MTKIEYCKSCNSYKYRNRWHKARKFSIDKNDEIKPIECPNCSRIKGNYYEGIFQLRNPENLSFQEVYDKIIQEARKANVGISGIKKVRNGVDYYFTSNKFMQQLAKKLYMLFGGEIKVSSKLFGVNKQTSKQIYRVNVLFRLPGLNIGDIIKINKEPFVVKKIAKEYVKGNYLRTNKQGQIRYNNKIETIAGKNDAQMVVVSKRKPAIEVLHPRTFQSTQLANKPDSEKSKISVIEVDGELFAV